MMQDRDRRRVERLDDQREAVGQVVARSGLSLPEKLVGHQMYIVFALALLLVYLVLAGQYESWYAPISVILAVPLSFIGPVLALSALTESGLNNNLYVQIGLVLLMALSAKNAILIVEFARELRAAGKPILDAATEAARACERRRRQRARVDRHYGVYRDDRIDLPGGAVRAAVLCGGAACRGMAQGAQGPLAGGYAGRIAGRVEAAAARSLQPLWNLLTQRQSQFGRRDSYGIPGFQHTKIAMARFALRVTTASALIFAAMLAADPVLRQAWAQESERPFGLFGI